MSLPTKIRITEVGPRDGLQNERAVLSVEQKVTFVDALSVSGAAEIEVSSFVSAKRVPQLGDAAEVFERIHRAPGVVYSALVPNEKGLERALAPGVGGVGGVGGRPDKVAVFTAASETFSRKNTNATIDETIERFRPVVQTAKAEGLPVRGYVSTIVECPYEGPIDPKQVRRVSEQLLEIGINELDLGETLGVAAPNDIERVYEALDGLVTPDQTTLHLHDTRGTALACAYRAMQLGVASFDASCAGLGGCPFAPGAMGNVATEDLVYLCQRLGCETGVDLDAMIAAGRVIQESLGRTLPGRVFQACARAVSDRGAMV